MSLPKDTGKNYVGWTKLPKFRNGGRWDWTTDPSIDSLALYHATTAPHSWLQGQWFCWSTVQFHMLPFWNSGRFIQLPLPDLTRDIKTCCSLLYGGRERSLRVVSCQSGVTWDYAPSKMASKTSQNPLKCLVFCLLLLMYLSSTELLFAGSQNELSQLQGFDLELDLQEKLHWSGEGSVSL